MYHHSLQRLDTICFREFLERPQQAPLAIKNIAESKFNATLIAGNPYRQLVTRHFEQYPVLYMDLKVNYIVYMPEMRAEQSKNVQGSTYEAMLKVLTESFLMNSIIEQASSVTALSIRFTHDGMN